MSEVAQAPHSSPDGRIPQLRFPEFDGVWESRLLKDAVKINPRSGELPDEFIYIDLESVKKGYLIKETQINKIGAPSRAQRLLNKNDVIFQTVRPYQKNNYFFNLDGDYVASTGYAQLRVLNSPEFLYQALHTDRFVYDVMARSTGTSYPAINSTDLSKIKLNLPTKPEQQKIATFLIAVDNKIEQLSKKQELLGEYKKGLMQQIFSQAIRFKADDGSAFPVWEEKNIVELAKTSIGLVTSMTPYYVDKGVPLIRNNDIFQNKIRKEKLIRLDYEFDQLNKNRRLFTNDIVTVHTGNIGASAVIDEELNGCQGFATLNTRIKNQNEISSSFLCWYYNSTRNIKYALSMATGDGRSNYNLKDFNKATIPVPSLPEQTKIAAFLTAADNKIEQVGKQFDESKQFKKALLQQMFV